MIKRTPTNKPEKVKVCYILSYRCPNYFRTKTLIDALNRIDNLVLFQSVNTAEGIFRYAQTLTKLLFIRAAKKPDYYILGFRGYEIFWIVRALTFGTPLIFDHMMSPYDSLLNERKAVKKGSVIDKAIYFYEKSILKYSDIILTDTATHKKYFTELFEANPEKIYAIHVGADEDLFKDSNSSKEPSNKDPFEVLFYGTFLPLHGIEVILKAASITRDNPIRFTIIGGKGKKLKNFYETKNRLSLNNVVHKRWVDYEQLPRLISKSDLCLGGHFGYTGQARRVISGKTFQFLSMGKPTIVGRIDEDYGFEDKKNCLVVSQGDEKELAEAILWCFENREKLGEIGRNGLELYENNLSIKSIKQSLLAVFK